MNWLSKIFRQSSSNQFKNSNRTGKSYSRGLELFKLGRELFKESIDEKIHVEIRKQKLISSLEFFDKAIDQGYVESEVYSFRGICLRDLNYDLDALDDFDTAISKDPERASYYYDRALTKQYIYDLQGSLVDFEEAIRLSKIDNSETRYWNKYAKETGYDSCTQKYEHDLQLLMWDINRAKESITMQNLISNKKKTIQRRYQ